MSKNTRTTQHLKAPYLVFIGDTDEAAYAKTALGLITWCAAEVAGQLRFKGNTLDLGVPDMTIKEAADAGVKSLVVGVAPVGGQLGPEWISVLADAAAAGMDVVNGLHLQLKNYPIIVDAAERGGGQLIDIRRPPEGLLVGTGHKRSGKRLLTVGTDCAVGKKYTALSISHALKAAGINCDFRATGQTGIMIAGQGIPMDAVVSDFIAGAAECLSPDNAAEHWDIIEGQGSLFHPGYAGVSLGLLHGSQPDAIVVCHDPSRKEMIGCAGRSVPEVSACIETNLHMGSLTNPAVRCVGVSVNTTGLSADDRVRVLDTLQGETGLPCVDPLIEGVEPIINKLLSE